MNLGNKTESWGGIAPIPAPWTDLISLGCRRFRQAGSNQRVAPGLHGWVMVVECPVVVTTVFPRDAEESRTPLHLAPPRPSIVGKTDEPIPSDS
ncbi:hypothetical protein PUN28_006160 [Cardiocondyla obscurior]|uniref:Uncharacterized protein n=1 Tax=Cardiocondyla obscurior TaxID=286306 RepID=A0AAW2GA91_9HYME